MKFGYNNFILGLAAFTFLTSLQARITQQAHTSFKPMEMEAFKSPKTPRKAELSAEGTLSVNKNQPDLNGRSLKISIDSSSTISENLTEPPTSSSPVRRLIDVQAVKSELDSALGGLKIDPTTDPKIYKVTDDKLVVYYEITEEPETKALFITFGSIDLSQLKETEPGAYPGNIKLMKLRVSAGEEDKDGAGKAAVLNDNIKAEIIAFTTNSLQRLKVAIIDRDQSPCAYFQSFIEGLRNGTCAPVEGNAVTAADTKVEVWKINPPNSQIQFIFKQDGVTNVHMRLFQAGDFFEATANKNVNLDQKKQLSTEVAAVLARGAKHLTETRALDILKSTLLKGCGADVVGSASIVNNRLTINQVEKAAADCLALKNSIYALVYILDTMSFIHLKVDNVFTTQEFKLSAYEDHLPGQLDQLIKAITAERKAFGDEFIDAATVEVSLETLSPKVLLPSNTKKVKCSDAANDKPLVYTCEATCHSRSIKVLTLRQDDTSWKISMRAPLLAKPLIINQTLFSIKKSNSFDQMGNPKASITELINAIEQDAGCKVL